MDDNKTDWISFSNFLLQEFLCMLPAHAGETLLQQLSTVKAAGRELKWYGHLLSWGAEDLITWAGRDGEPEDKCAFLNVFLWKQRHGLIDRGLRIRAFLGPGARPLTYYIHRYMVALGYEGILDGTDPCTQVGVKYVQEIKVLLDQWQAPGFGDSELSFWDLILLLNVLGPKLSAYERRSEVQDLAEYILASHSVDKRLTRFNDDPELAAFALLISDLGLDPHLTWPVFQKLLLSKSKRSVMLYPALIVGMQMYGTDLRESLKRIDLQGGMDLFYALVGS